MKPVYHITSVFNLPGILRNGLIPRYGPRYESCTKEYSKTPYIFCTDYNHLESWTKALYKDQAVAILEISDPNLTYKIRKKFLDSPEYLIKTPINPQYINIYNI